MYHAYMVIIATTSLTVITAAYINGYYVTLQCLVLTDLRIYDFMKVLDGLFRDLYELLSDT